MNKILILYITEYWLNEILKIKEDDQDQLEGWTESDGAPENRKLRRIYMSRINQARLVTLKTFSHRLDQE